MIQALAAEVGRCRGAADAATIRATRAEGAAADASGRLREADDIARRHTALQASAAAGGLALILTIQDGYLSHQCS